MAEQDEPRGEYNQSMTINASADEVFDFVADIANLPKYLPTTKHAEPQQGERVLVQGAVEGHGTYEADGYLRPDRDNYKMEWGADERYYSGRLEIEPQGDDKSEVTIHLKFSGRPPGSEEGEGPSDEQVNDGITKALQSIENHVTGKGGKVKPEAEA